MVFAPHGSNVILNVTYGNLPSTVTREAFEALEQKLTNATSTIELLIPVIPNRKAAHNKNGTTE